LDGLSEDLEQFGGDVLGILTLLHAFDDDHKLVAAHAGDGVTSAHANKQTMGHLAEYEITGGMTVVIVDLFELVEADP